MVIKAKRGGGVAAATGGVAAVQGGVALDRPYVYSLV